MKLITCDSPHAVKMLLLSSKEEDFTLEVLNWCCETSGEEQRRCWGVQRPWNTSVTCSKDTHRRINICIYLPSRTHVGSAVIHGMSEHKLSCMTGVNTCSSGGRETEISSIAAVSRLKAELPVREMRNSDSLHLDELMCFPDCQQLLMWCDAVLMLLMLACERTPSSIGLMWRSWCLTGSGWVRLFECS